MLRAPGWHNLGVSACLIGDYLQLAFKGDFAILNPA
jgi:hypothetical protein